MYYRQILIEHAQEDNPADLIDILEKAASIPKIYDTIDDASWSVLHHAVFRGNVEICKILINAGANVYVCDKFGKTPLHFAIQKGYSEIANMILDVSHPLDYPKIAKLTLMQTAATNGHPGLIRRLAKMGTNVNDRNSIGETPLHMATRSGSVPAMTALLDCGADVSSRTDKIGHTPMHYACMHGHVEGTLLLLRRGGDAHVGDDTVLGRTPLETAKDSGFRPLFNLLLDEETRIREEGEERKGREEYMKEEKHDKLMEKFDTLKKTNAGLMKDLKTMRIEDKLMEEDHNLRMQKEKKAAIARRRSRKRLSNAQKSQGKKDFGSRASSRASMRSGFSAGYNSGADSQSETESTGFRSPPVTPAGSRGPSRSGSRGGGRVSFRGRGEEEVGVELESSFVSEMTSFEDGRDHL